MLKLKGPNSRQPYNRQFHNTYIAQGKLSQRVTQQLFDSVTLELLVDYKECRVVVRHPVERFHNYIEFQVSRAAGQKTWMYGFVSWCLFLRYPGGTTTTRVGTTRRVWRRVTHYTKFFVHSTNIPTEFDALSPLFYQAFRAFVFRIDFHRFYFFAKFDWHRIAADSEPATAIVLGTK